MTLLVIGRVAHRFRNHVCFSSTSFMNSISPRSWFLATTVQGRTSLITVSLSHHMSLGSPLSAQTLHDSSSADLSAAVSKLYSGHAVLNCQNVYQRSQEILVARLRHGIDPMLKGEFCSFMYNPFQIFGKCGTPSVDTWIVHLMCVHDSDRLWIVGRVFLLWEHLACCAVRIEHWKGSIVGTKGRGLVAYPPCNSSFECFRKEMSYICFVPPFKMNRAARKLKSPLKVKTFNNLYPSFNLHDQLSNRQTARQDRAVTHPLPAAFCCGFQLQPDNNDHSRW